MNEPKVSILLPTYRTAPRLAAAIESVQMQMYSDWELLVIDDGLTPETRTAAAGLAVRDPRIRILKNEAQHGIQFSLARGLSEAAGVYLARIDDDDVWVDREKLAAQVRYLEEHPSCVLVGTNATIIDEKGNRLETYRLPRTDQAIRKRLLSKNCFIHPSILMRKSAALLVGGYDTSPEVQHIEDYALWLKLGRVGTLANLAEPMLALTVHEQSMTFQNRLLQARRIFKLISQYRGVYPRYGVSRIILLVRIIGFWLLSVVPIPKRMLYKIQKLYKSY